jgi:hypothetical protein
LFPSRTVQAVHAAEGNPVVVTIDYPLNGSVFPPEITPPTFIWRDADDAAKRWWIDVVFADGSPETRIESPSEPFHIGEIDQRCISARNELPQLTPEQAVADTWIPDAKTWEKIKRHSSASLAEGRQRFKPRRTWSERLSFTTMCPDAV